MLLETSIKDPIWVINPHTNQNVNIAPLFDLLAQFGGSDQSAREVGVSIKNIGRLLNLVPHDQLVVGPIAVTDANYNLYLLEDMFELMATA